MATLKEKVQVYESLLHSIQMNSSVIMDQAAMAHLIDIVNNWSYAHRSGNGELSEREQAKRVDFYFQKMKNHEWTQSNWNSGMDTPYKQRYNTIKKST